MNLRAGPERVLLSFAGRVRDAGYEAQRVRERFNFPEWQKLVRLPSVIYFAVANADGRPDHYEADRFLEYINQATPPNDLLRQVYNEAAEEGPDAVRLTDEEHDWLRYLSELRALLEQKLSDDERRMFLAGLLGMGHSVAAASGGFFGLGNKVSPVEEQRLQAISDALGLSRLLAG